MKKIVLASNNKGKLAEFEQLFYDLPCEIVPQSFFNIPDADEIGLTFIENAIIKARHASQLSGLPAIADDSGLAIDALQGAPGIYSARYAGEHGNSGANVKKVLDKLEGLSELQRTARFHCCLAYLQYAEDPVPIICHGTLEGLITTAPRGSNGFGYDPILYLAEFGCTVAELDADHKNQISHRARAMQMLQKYLR